MFSMVIDVCVFTILATFIYLGSSQNPSISRFIYIMAISLLLAFTASYIISKFALQPVKQAWQRQLDFTADASHELRTPLAVIQTNLEIVMDSPDETVASQMKWLENINHEHSRMTKLVEDLLTLSRADSGEQNLFLSVFLFDETLMQAVKSFHPLCQQNNISLEYNIEKGISFCGDERRISQLIIILLDNAIKYMQPPGNISVNLQLLEKKLILTIQDTGMGIPKKDTKKIFERFYRSDHTRGQNPNGSGLGLSIARWIATEHNGIISVKSELGEGTTITVAFPISINIKKNPVS